MNLVDVIWIDRPPSPQEPVRPHPLEFAGECAASKLERIRQKLAADKVDALVVSDPHNLAWAFNLRGGDVACTPLPLGYAIIPNEGRAQLFFDPVKVTNEAGDAVGDLADFVDPSAGSSQPSTSWAVQARKFASTATTGAVAITRRIEAAGGSPDVGADPIALMKAVKNEAEIAGSRAAHLRDGAAVTRYPRLAGPGSAGRHGSPRSMRSRNSESFRIETGAIKNISFPTIAGAGPERRLAALPRKHCEQSARSR